MLLPLRDLLNVPLHQLRLVVDNARSPKYPVSLKKRRRKRLTRRSLSLDDSDTSSNRWTSIVPLVPHFNEKETEDKHAGPTASPRSGHRRACSLDGFNQTIDNSSSPLRIPLRRQSPPSSPLDSDRPLIRSPTSPRLPIRRASPKPVKKSSAVPDKPTMNKLFNKSEEAFGSKRLLNLPTFELREDSIHEERASEEKYTRVASENRNNYSTTDFLTQALESLHIVE